MSVVQPAMLTELPGTRGYNDIFAQFKARMPTPKQATPGSHYYVKKRSYSDQATECDSVADESLKKRSRTAPPSPPSMLHLSPGFSATLPAPALKPAQNITLPSLSDALRMARPPKSIVPTVSLDYFDTYKPNDENWRFGLLDTIRSTKPSFSLASYGYLGKHAESAPKLPSIQTRPQFDARVSPKAMPALAERKINFPYESNYTYLNQTYMTDVERYPEYLELAQSLVALSRQHRESGKNYQPSYRDQREQREEKEQKQTEQRHTDRHTDRHTEHTHTRNRHSGAIPGASRPSPEGSPAVATISGANTSSSISDATTATISGFANTGGSDSVESTANLPHASASASASPPSARASPTRQNASVYDYNSYYYASQAARYVTPDASFELKPASPKKDRKVSQQRTRFIPITPPSVKDKTRSELMKSPPRTSQAAPRVCISCGSDQSPCWRPSWSIKEGQLCNSCGLRYKKTAARCLNDECKKIPAKGEWSLMQTKGKTHYEDGDGYSCLDCGSKVEVRR